MAGLARALLSHLCVMSHELPKTIGQLIELGNKMINGLTVEGQALKITQITAAKFQTALTAFENAENGFNAGRSARQAASDVFQAADSALLEWLGVVKTVLAGRFGQRWSTVWAQAGFINNSTAIPTKIADRTALAGRLVAFFTKNPSYEVRQMKVSAANGTALLTAQANAQNKLTAAATALKTLEGTWDNAHAALTDMMWSLIKILQATLSDLNPIWLEFGLPMPGTPSTPGKPVNVSAHSDGTGAIVVQCDAVPLATRYRWRMLLVGVESDYRLVASGTEPLASITGIAPGVTVQIIAQAVNGSLQGVASEAIRYTVPLAAQPKKPEPSTAPARETTTEAGKAPGNSLGLTHRMLPRVG